MSSNVVAWWDAVMPAARAASTASRASRPTPTNSSAPAATTARPISWCAPSAIPPSSNISPRTTTRRPDRAAARLAAAVSSADRTDTGLALYVSSRTRTPPASRQMQRPATAVVRGVPEARGGRIRS